MIGQSASTSVCIIESRAKCESVPIKALIQAVLLEMLGSTASQRVCQPGDKRPFHQPSTHSLGFRPNVAAIIATPMAPGSVCSQGCAGSPISRKSVTGSRSIKTFESAKIDQLKCLGAIILTRAPGPKWNGVIGKQSSLFFDSREFSYG